MKLITAIIREAELDKVREALIEADISRITVSRVAGHGQQKRIEVYRGNIVVPNLIPKIRLEIAVNEEYVEKTIDTIIATARSGEIGDGKIFITNLEDCIRIRTGARGKDAI